MRAATRAWRGDCYRRLIQGYAQVVEALPTEPFDTLVKAATERDQVADEHELDFRALRTLTQAMMALFRKLTGHAFPEDPNEQLSRVTFAVFRSWDAPKAASYRRLNGLDDTAGTAVTVQMMVFGNAGGASGSGVAFTRDPATGTAELYLDFQFGGQGEDVVAGRQSLSGAGQLRARLPAIWARLEDVGRELEALFRDAQDLEFTLQAGTLYLLQARNAKRTSLAALRIAVDLVEQGLITPMEALTHLEGIDLDALISTRFTDHAAPSVGSGTVAGTGVASGAIALDSAAVARLQLQGTPAILLRREATTADIEGIAQAAGLLTAAGARTSHAAVVARQLGKVCLVGCSDLTVDLDKRCCRIGGQIFQEGEFLSLDGNDGAIFAGVLPVMTECPERELAIVARWRGGSSAKTAQEVPHADNSGHAKHRPKVAHQEA